MVKKKYTDFDIRMKEYEKAYKIKLPKRMPVLVRIDGKAFHTYTKGMEKPFDENIAKAMWETSKYLAENIMGCKVVYHQSDEISLLITNYDKLTTESWFSNSLQKIASISASLATYKFNDYMKTNNFSDKAAIFDARAWVLPQDEVCNYFLWRQQDCTKNSISMVAQANFSHKQLHRLSGSQMQDKLMLERGINWNNLPTWQKRGVCITKQYHSKGETKRSRWEVDLEIPIFSKDRSYIDQYVYLNK
ncbi:tRNA-His guanylyltransferase [Bacillus phage G]|uniref:Gp378 n=1 Tax=Bacillus phage G TaxID=2884420 RepID=G3MAB9_9CAUD|nr:tRNA-His guanylyltransferase [Bacillus phage G]AEO93637.1 gp378 [Bacillus phage G]